MFPNCFATNSYQKSLLLGVHYVGYCVIITMNFGNSGQLMEMEKGKKVKKVSVCYGEYNNSKQSVFFLA